MPRMVCTPCEQTYRVIDNNIVVVTYAQDEPYQLWFADEWACPTCKNRVVSGFGQGPIWRRGEEGYDKLLEGLSRQWNIRHERELVMEAVE